MRKVPLGTLYHLLCPGEMGPADGVHGEDNTLVTPVDEIIRGHTVVVAHAPTRVVGEVAAARDVHTPTKHEWRWIARVTLSEDLVLSSDWHGQH